MMPDLLDPVGHLEYNDVIWGMLYKSTIQNEPQYAKDRRSVKYNTIALTVEGIIFADSAPMAAAPLAETTDPLMMALRIKLTQNAKALKYTAKGYGNLVVNSPGTPGNTFDVAFGPSPELIDFQPMGGGRSALVTWKVSINIVESKTPKFDGVLAFTRSDDITYDEVGYMVYTVSGELEIAATLTARGGVEVQSNFAYNFVSAYLDPLVPIGFKTSRRDFKFSEDGRTVSFNFTWEEMAPGGLPLACTGAGGEYTIASTDKGFLKWQMTLRASYYVRKDVTRNTAWIRFVNLYRSRSAIGLNPRFSAANRRAIILTSFKVTEGLYADSKKNDFEFSWIYFNELAKILIRGRMWSAIDNEDYRKWRTGVDLPIAGPLPPPRGYNRLDQERGNADIMGSKSWTRETDRHFGQSRADAVIDIFHQPPGGASPSLLNRSLLDVIGDMDEKDHPAFRGLRGVFNTPDELKRLEILALPSPEASWADYHCEVFTDLDPGLAIHKPLPQNDDEPDSLATRDLDYQAKNYPTNEEDYNLNSHSSGSDIVQRMATSTYRVCLRGYAVRAGYPVPIPGLIKFAGQSPTPIKPQRVWRASRASLGGIPIFMARWELWYQLSVPPKVKKADAYPQNPAVGIQPATDKIPDKVTAPEGVFGERIQQEYQEPLLNPLPR